MNFMAVCLFFFLFVYCESPSAEPFGRVDVGRTTDTFGADTVVYSFGEPCVLDESGAFARIISESFSYAGGLHATVIHLENQRVVFPSAGLAVQSSVNAEVQRAF